jgi:hypothetical protein
MSFHPSTTLLYLRRTRQSQPCSQSFTSEKSRISIFENLIKEIVGGYFSPKYLLLLIRKNIKRGSASAQTSGQTAVSGCPHLHPVPYCDAHSSLRLVPISLQRRRLSGRSSSDCAPCTQLPRPACNRTDQLYEIK